MDAGLLQDSRRLDGPLGSVWQQLSLARQFTLAAIVISFVIIVILGNWVSRKIETNIVDNAAATTSVYIGHFMAPLLQELGSSDQLSPESIAALDGVMKNVVLDARLVAIKVWLQNGRVVYSTKSDLIGKTYPPGESLTRAWSGVVAAEYNNLHGEESAALERDSGLPLLEVYAPIHSESKGDVIAVAEFYKRAEYIAEQLTRVKWQSWSITTLLTVAMIGGLFSIVADGSRTIEKQRAALIQRISELSSLLTQNKTLRDRVERGARQATEHHERFLRQIGSELHDGPAQLVGLALLRLDSLGSGIGNRDASLIRGVLSDALDEIRNICAGLLLPETENCNLQDALSYTIRNHERRTRTSVSFIGRDLPVNPRRYVTLCMCRFVQEGLTNAFRHAGGKGQTVSAWADDTSVCVEVTDQGPGIQSGHAQLDRMPLGLIGLRGRVESIGGTMTISCPPQGGTRLTARLPLSPEG